MMLTIIWLDFDTPEITDLKIIDVSILYLSKQEPGKLDTFGKVKYKIKVVVK